MVPAASKEGPDYGYFAEASKSIIIVKEKCLRRAKVLFEKLNVEVVLASRFLGVVLVAGKEFKILSVTRSASG